jgi:uncharacterized membrane protein YfcA
MDQFAIHTYFILAGAAFVGGFVDSIAGGGGIITVPVLLSIGLPVPLALGTNKLQAAFGSLTASVNYIRKDLADLKDTVPGILCTAIGAAVGAFALQRIDPSFLARAVPIMLIAIFAYLLLSPEFGHKERRARMNRYAFYATFGLAIGFYDGFFGPGTGNFWTIAFVVLLGLNLKNATAHTKIMNFTSNIISLAVFIHGGNVLFKVGLTMAAGQLIGAYIGSHLVITKGVKFVKVFFMTVVAITIAKLVYSTYIQPMIQH